MDEDILETPETSEEIFTPLDPEPASEPEPAPAPEPELTPEPEAPAAPVEVITVEDLLDRITGETGEDGETEEPSQETEGDAGTEAPVESGEALPAEGGLEGPIEVVGMDKLLEYTGMIQETLDHPLMTTPFEDYTVTEGLLLLIFVILLLNFFLDLLRRWF